MPKGSKNKKPTVLMKWRFFPDEKGKAGAAKYWWSDGSKTEENVISHSDAISRLKIIQDRGGVKDI